VPRAKGYTLDTFFISSEFISSDAGRPDLSREMPVGQFVPIGLHLIKIENLTTLPCDVEISSKSSDADNGYSFDVGGGMHQGWTASFKSILTKGDERTCNLLQRNGSNRIARIQTTNLRYKRPIWPGWDEHELRPALEIAIECK
jgi:hypothetical protein